jgi:hypothetical protein
MPEVFHYIFSMPYMTMAYSYNSPYLRSKVKVTISCGIYGLITYNLSETEKLPEKAVQ